MVGYGPIANSYLGSGFDDRFDAQNIAEGTVQCQVRVRIHSPKQLTVEEFKDLKGSILYGKMFENRIVLDLTCSDRGSRSFLNDVHEWVADAASGFYCIDALTLYFEKEADAVNFHLRFDGQTEVTTIQPDRSW